jgi:uncharacterized protein
MKLLIISLLLLSTSTVVAQSSIPTFTPNVVDPLNYLEANEVAEINQKIDSLKSQDIWAAVYVTDKLQNESIEELAFNSFNEWKLGEKGKDNGLLLVLVMKDRKSRFEVGYGLEGTLTDFITHKALTKVLAPRMKSKEYKLAIIESFDYLQKVNGGEIVVKPPKKNLLGHFDGFQISFFDEKGIYTWIYYVCFVWLSFPSLIILNYYSISKLRKKYPEETFVQILKADSGLTKKTKFLPLIIMIFLTINPGAFVILLTNLIPGFMYFIILICPYIFHKFLRSKLKIYLSKENYLEELNEVRSSYKSLITKGFIVEEPFGTFKYTPAWFSSNEYLESKRVAELNRRSSSSSSGSSGSRSSSGGGRSGGGGSSSSW